jgi:hypothetical protein
VIVRVLAGQDHVDREKTQLLTEMAFDSRRGLASIRPMRSSSKFGLLLLATSLLGLGCAPRVSTNLYARWSQQDQTRRAEMQREEKIRAEVERRMGKASPSSAAETPALKAPVQIDSAEPGTPPIAPAETTRSSDDSNAMKTPPIRTRTATRSRAVKPIFQEMEEEEKEEEEEEEEETIY